MSCNLCQTHEFPNVGDNRVELLDFIVKMSHNKNVMHEMEGVHEKISI